MFSLSDIHPSESLPHVWLLAFALSATLALLGVACQVLRLGRVKRPSWAIWTSLSWLLAALCFTSIFERLNGWLPGWLALIAKSSLIALVPLACYGLIALRGAKSSVHAGPRLSWGLVAANALAAVWASGSFYEAIAPEVFSPLSFPARDSIRWVQIDNAKAYTDRKNGVNLLRLEVPNDDGSRDFGAAAPIHGIQVAACDDRANCHGWVFTGGEFGVSGDDVDTILFDNLYDVVEHPQPGDLIVYRGNQGEVLHSGVVRLVEEGVQEHLVLVESKWGALARYLHQPRDQGYSTSYEFYRSPRHGHLVHWRDEPTHDASPKSVVASDAKMRSVVMSAATGKTNDPSSLPD